MAIEEIEELRSFCHDSNIVGERGSYWFLSHAPLFSTDVWNGEAVNSNRS